jgi:amino acid adenylation domain-containing protein/non-ribosomal peptide synthase protein (TIGR01720 family)
MNQHSLTGFRLSQQQRHLWTAQQNDPAYRAECVLLLEGDLHVENLKEALRDVVARHEALHTTFRRAASLKMPLQVLDESVVPSWRIAGVTADATRDEQSIIDEARGEEARLPFDLEHGPLLRAVLIPFSSNRHALLLTLPALCADTTSLQYLLDGLVRSYAALRGGQTIVEEPVQYVQFSEWQNELLIAEDAEEGREYWDKQDFSSSSALKLPLESKTLFDAPFKPREVVARLPTGVAGKIDALAARHDTTIDAVLLACWHILLWRLTGEPPEVVSGKVFDGRKYEEFEGLVGLASKWVPIKSLFKADSSFEDILSQIDEALQDAWEWQEFFIQENGGGQQSDERTAPPILFEFEERRTRYHAAGLSLTIHEQRCLIDRFKLKLNCVRAAGEIAFEFLYDANIFDETNVRRFAGYFERLTSDLAGAPAKPACEAVLLSEDERHRLAVEFNRTAADYPQDACIHELFEEQARRNPGNVAVVCEDGQLTYEELNVGSNRLAHLLVSRGVNAGDVVGICLERSTQMFVALLSILKAGGAYLPLDPEHPPARMAYQLETARASILITQESLLAGMPEFDGEILSIDSNETRCGDQPQTNPARATSTQNPVYAIYTSGSTGAPKAVGVSHRNLVNYSHFICQKLGAEAGVNGAPLHFGTVSTLSADLGNTSIFPALISGGCLHVISHEAAMDGGKFAAYAAEHPIDVLKIVPSHFSALLAEGGAAILPRAFLILGGEALPFELVKRIREVSGECRIINHYGPTETTVGALTYDLSESIENSFDAKTVPIGRPIANAEIYILDRRMNLLPAGVAGELYIGGGGVAAGYLNQPAATAERFLANPFSPHRGARMYRTGDIARRLPDGNVEFLGRADQQVKIRGYRIELGEIESALSKHEEVREAVVVERRDASGTGRLIAYVVSRRPLGREALQAFLSHTLPSYMVPASFVFLKSLPITRNGKVDRSALPDPGSAQAQRTEGYVAPRTPIEEMLAKIWSEVLGREPIGIHDNFFELGGDSILSIQIISRANRAGLHLTAKHVFQHQTIAELSPMAMTNRGVRVEQRAVTGAVPLTPIQQRFFETQDADLHHYNQSVLLETQEGLDAAALEESVRHLIRHHDALRLRFDRETSGWRQMNTAPEDTVPFLKVDLSGVSPEERATAIESVATQQQASLDLASGTLLKVVLMDFGAGLRARVLIVAHHLVVDGVSWRILLEDLQTAYEQLSAGKAVELPGKTSSFQLWAQRLNQYADGEDARRELAYWVGGERRKVGRLRPDKPEGINNVASARNVTVGLTLEETQALLRDVPAVYRTQINDALLTALAQVYAGRTGTPALLVGLEGHGRESLFEDIDLSRTVGWFTSYFPLYLNLENASAPGDALKSVKEQLRNMPNRGIGWGILRYLNKDEAIVTQLRELPSADISFNYLGQLDQVIPEKSFFGVASESAGATRSPRGMRSHLIDINAHVAGGRLWLSWVYSENIHHRSTIETLANAYVDALRLLIEHCRSAEAGGYTPTDFPLARLSQAKLDQLFGASREIEDIYPLSPMQRGMLFESLYAPEKGAYFVQISCALEGELDADAFARAWQQVCERHAILRTSFAWEELDEPLQVVRRHVELPFHREDWRGLPPAEQQERLAALLLADRARGFKLSQAPLMRVTLIRLGDDSYYVIWSNHHLILDGWCRPLVVNEVLTGYEAFLQGEHARLEPTGQFRDYIAWLQAQDLSEAEAFWRQEMRGFTSPTTLNTGRAQGEGNGYVEEALSISAETTAALQELARQHQLTLHTLVQGAWALLLSRHSGSRDVVFGATVSGRPAELVGGDSIIGLFINTLPVRVRLSPTDSLLPWLKNLQEHQAEMRQYEYAPLAQIHGWSDVPRRLPLFENIFVFNNHPATSSLKEQGRSLELRNFHSVNWSNVYASYPLILVISPGRQLTIRMIYDSARFDAERITDMLAHFENVLEEMTTNTTRQLIDIALIKDEEMRLPADLHGVYAADESEQEQFDFEL